MAGARKFNVSEIKRADLMSANRETAAETFISCITEAEEESAQAILKA